MKRLLLILALLLATAPATAQPAGDSAAKPATVRVVASATTTVKPDLAEVDLGVSTDKPAAAAATSENARKMEQIVAAMKKEAGAGGEVKTVGFNVSTRYGQPRPGSDQPTVVGYTVTSTVRVRTNDVNGIGRILDAAFKLGSNNVQRVAFLLKDQEPAQTEALKQATAKARGRATAMASALGLKVGPVLTISEGYDEPMPVEHYAEAAISHNVRMASTPIEAGTLEVRATVTVVFALGR
jgi:uncharacterized protein YggE